MECVVGAPKRLGPNEIPPGLGEQGSQPAMCVGIFFKSSTHVSLCIELDGLAKACEVPKRRCSKKKTFSIRGKKGCHPTPSPYGF